MENAVLSAWQETLVKFSLNSRGVKEAEDCVLHLKFRVSLVLYVALFVFHMDFDAADWETLLPFKMWYVLCIGICCVFLFEQVSATRKF